MYKLVILINALDDWEEFESGWPEFLQFAEQMPGLRKETSSRVIKNLYGGSPTARIHELYFDSLSAMEIAMSSEAGKMAGKILQEISGGKVALLFSDHHEDDIKNIENFRVR